MIRRLAAGAAATALALSAAPAAAQLGSHNPEPGPRATVAIRNARIVPVSGPEITGGTLVISDGKIQAIGVNVPIPQGAQIIDGTGLSVYPGMTEAGSQMGLREIESGANATNDLAETGRFNPNIQALSGVNPHSAHIGVSRVVGITNVITRPSGGVISGQAALLNMAGFVASEMAVVPRTAMVISYPGLGGGGGGFRGGAGGASNEPVTPLDSLNMLLDAAEAYGKAMDAHAANPASPRPKTDLFLAALVPVVRGEMPVMFPAETETAIRTVVEYAKERGLKPIIVGARDAWKLTDFLKENDVPVIFSRTQALPPNEDDPYDVHYSAPAKLAAAGVKFAISSGEADPDIRNLPYIAGMASAFGLSREDALRAVTLWPAEIFGVADRIGSLEVGKMANLVVTDGDLLEATTDTRYLFIDGRNVPLNTRHTDLYDMFKDRVGPKQPVNLKP